MVLEDNVVGTTEALGLLSATPQQTSHAEQLLLFS